MIIGLTHDHIDHGDSVGWLVTLRQGVAPSARSVAGYHASLPVGFDQMFESLCQDLFPSHKGRYPSYPLETDTWGIWESILGRFFFTLICPNRAVCQKNTDQSPHQPQARMISPRYKAIKAARRLVQWRRLWTRWHEHDRQRRQ